LQFKMYFKPFVHVICFQAASEAYSVHQVYNFMLLFLCLLSL
jgi:hypothetical protein